MKKMIVMLVDLEKEFTSKRKVVENLSKALIENGVTEAQVNIIDILGVFDKKQTAKTTVKCTKVQNSDDDNHLKIVFKERTQRYEKGLQAITNHIERKDMQSEKAIISFIVSKCVTDKNYYEVLKYLVHTSEVTYSQKINACKDYSISYNILVKALTIFEDTFESIINAYKQSI